MFSRNQVCPKGPEEMAKVRPCKGYMKKVDGQEELVLSCNCPLCSRYKSYIAKERGLTV